MREVDANVCIMQHAHEDERSRMALLHYEELREMKLLHLDELHEMKLLHLEDREGLTEQVSQGARP
jgi:hypothetical protein